MTTGESVFNPHAVRVRAYPVAVEDADCSADADCAPDDVSVETYPVSVERRMVVLRGVSGVSQRA